ncbi:serine beta-lactamase-like protein LACTB, mitochondrial [Haliotis rubra]|uniref:serine beta-lactamase-like protein LACTB, mitochondrial n=1 Tax=Haliotis rubra TaxID=36100 RepID=UPI001EE55CC3|nr:serine beta-lactamase-like protein LACTB, mitochondrial [Haliotis rubra]
MLRNAFACTRYVKPYIKNISKTRLLAQTERNPLCRFYSGSHGTARHSLRLGPSNLRVIGRCAFVLVGTCMGVKMWLISAGCEEAAHPDSAQTEYKGDTSQTLEEAIAKSRDILQRVKDETGSPGIVVGVSVDGKQVWNLGLGYQDVENRVACTPDTVMRIASISKPITMAVAGKLKEMGLLDLDRPVQDYVPYFPEKLVDGRKVTITTRQLLSHLGGIRHYGKEYMKDKDKADKTSIENASPEKAEMEHLEYYLKKHFKSVKSSLELFKDDPLVHKPGSKFLYTTHGYTLVSAVLEGASKKTFRELLLGLFKDLGLKHTYLDENTPVIYNRSRYYVKNNKGRLINAPYVDNSYKWAGGGLLSTVADLCKFGNVMLYSYQHQLPEKSVVEDTDPRSQSDLDTSANGKQTEGSEKRYLNGYLKRETVGEMWQPVDNTECSWDKDGGYALGWAIIPEKLDHGCCRHQRHYVTHTGGAIGASSVLVVVPRSGVDNPPSGVVVAIMVNMISIGLNKTALSIAEEFEKVGKLRR